MIAKHTAVRVAILGMLGQALTGQGLAGQTPARPTFEVSSVKLAAPGEYGTDLEIEPGGSIAMHNATLKDMIVYAWGMQPFQVTGGPPWLDSIHYQVTAKPAYNPKPGELPQMLQALLMDRFQLATHRGAQKLPAYTLSVAKKDGKFGPGLIESKEGDCTRYDPAKPPGPLPAGNPPRRYCGNGSVNPSRLTGIGIPIANLIPMLSQVLGQTVIDKTGLAGNFDVSLSWTPDETQAMKWQLPPGAAAPPAPDPAGPSIFTAVQQQLGLKLESGREQVDVLIVDSAAKPDGN